MSSKVLSLPAWHIAGLLALLCTALLAGMPQALSQDLIRGNYYWYAPEHEIYSKTQFYSQPRFDTAQVRIPRTQRFKLVAGSKGWFMVEFDTAGKAYIHMRLLRNLIHDPAATDPWYEFKRASVFAEDPSRIAARLKAASTQAPAPQAPESNAPSWKRYKDSWNLKPGRTPTPAIESGDPTSASPSPRPAEKKPRNKYPLLPPIGSEPAREGAEKDGAPGDPTGTSGAQP